MLSWTTYWHAPPPLQHMTSEAICATGMISGASTHMPAPQPSGNGWKQVTRPSDPSAPCSQYFLLVPFGQRPRVSVLEHCAVVLANVQHTSAFHTGTSGADHLQKRDRV